MNSLIPNKSFKKRTSITLYLYFILILVYQKFEINTEILFLICTLLMWFGTADIFKILFIKTLKESKMPKRKRLDISIIVGLFIIVCYTSPIVLYLLAKGII